MSRVEPGPTLASRKDRGLGSVALGTMARRTRPNAAQPGLALGCRSTAIATSVSPRAPRLGGRDLAPPTMVSSTTIVPDPRFSDER